MNIQIRPEKEDEFPLIYDLVKTAFKTAQVSCGKEQDFVNHLRAGENYIPELALVAANENSQIIGHIMLTKTEIQRENNKTFDALLLAPISVVQEYRNQGIGKQLIENVFHRARENNYGAVILVGNPDYYKRFGFKSAASFGIENTNSIPEQYVLACELTSGALDKVKGAITFETP